MSNYPPAADLAGRLNQLFRDREITNKEAAEGINALAGDKIISASYLGMLRRGERRQVTVERLSGIAAFFDVDLSYFTAASTIQDQSQTLFTALADPRVRALAVTASGLSDDSLRLLQQTADRFRAAEDVAAHPTSEPTE